MDWMTAKEALYERVGRLTEAEAEEWLQRMDWESTEEETLSADEVAEVLAGEQELAEGKSVTGAELFAKLNL
jgi:hypothetical protein